MRLRVSYKKKIWNYFFCILKSLMKGVGFGSISQRYRSADPDPHQNVTDPQQWLKLRNMRLSTWFPIGLIGMLEEEGIPAQGGGDKRPVGGVHWVHGVQQVRELEDRLLQHQLLQHGAAPTPGQGDKGSVFRDPDPLNPCICSIRVHAFPDTSDTWNGMNLDPCILLNPESDPLI